MEPVTPLTEPVTDGPLIHVAYPLVRGKLVFEPVVGEPAAAERHYLELELPVAGPEGEMVRKVEEFIASTSNFDVLLGGAGLVRNTTRSSATTGWLRLVLDPLSQIGAQRRLAEIARVTVTAMELAGTPVRIEVKAA